VVSAEEYKARVGCEGERLFVESEISCVHRWVTETA
jgi:hypothetical protein